MYYNNILVGFIITVEHLKLMPTLSPTPPTNSMIDTDSQSKQSSGSMNSPSSNIKREATLANNKTTASPSQLSYKSSDSPMPRSVSARSNSSPPVFVGSGTSLYTVYPFRNSSGEIEIA